MQSPLLIVDDDRDILALVDTVALKEGFCHGLHHRIPAGRGTVTRPGAAWEKAS